MKLMKSENATDVVAHDVPPVSVSTDPQTFSRIGWAIVIGGVLAFLIWAMVAPLDKGVPVQGSLIVDSNRKSVQHQQGGTVDAILVKEGDAVKAGQVLVRMNPSVSRANYNLLFAQSMSLSATVARLTAERDGVHEIHFPPELLKEQNNPEVVNILTVQRQLLVARQQAMASDLAAAEENIAGLRIQAAGLRDVDESKLEQLKSLKEQVDGMRDLAKDGYVARNRLLELERSYLQVDASLREDRANIAKTERQIAEITLRRTQRQQEYQREVRTQLADNQRDADAAAARLQAAKFELDNVEVKAPADGIVMGMAVFTSGGVVAPGFRMMDVVPIGDSLIVEGQVPVNLIDRVHVGLPVDLVFSAFNTNTTPHIPGEVNQVSADRFTDERSGAAYYKVRVAVTKEGMHRIQVKKLTLRPGMPVEIFVHTGERTMMNYLLKPVFDRAKMSMSEE